MLSVVLQKQKERKQIVLMILFFTLFMFLYTLLDDFNGGYNKMLEEYHLFLPIINISLNIIMSAISAFMMVMSYTFFKLSGKEGKGSFLSGISVLFGILTYGCTSCVILFFATIGITFSVVALPLAGLPYKLVSLLIVLIGLFWLIHEIKYPKCKIKINEVDHE